jgi:hypothetical protein
MKARARERELKSAIRRAHEQTQEAEVVKVQALEEQIRVEVNRRMHPRSGKDFEVLYDELEVRRLQELERIKASLDGGTTVSSASSNIFVTHFKMQLLFQPQQVTGQLWLHVFKGSRWSGASF